MPQDFRQHHTRLALFESKIRGIVLFYVSTYAPAAALSDKEFNHILFTIILRSHHPFARILAISYAVPQGYALDTHTVISSAVLGK